MLSATGRTRLPVHSFCPHPVIRSWMTFGSLWHNFGVVSGHNGIKCEIRFRLSVIWPLKLQLCFGFVNSGFVPMSAERGLNSIARIILSCPRLSDTHGLKLLHYYPIKYFDTSVGACFTMFENTIEFILMLQCFEYYVHIRLLVCTYILFEGNTCFDDFHSNFLKLVCIHFSYFRENKKYTNPDRNVCRQKWKAPLSMVRKKHVFNRFWSNLVVIQFECCHYLPILALRLS